MLDSNSNHSIIVFLILKADLSLKPGKKLSKRFNILEESSSNFQAEPRLYPPLQKTLLQFQNKAVVGKSAPIKKFERKGVVPEKNWLIKKKEIFYLAVALNENKSLPSH